MSLFGKKCPRCGAKMTKESSPVDSGGVGLYSPREVQWRCEQCCDEASMHDILRTKALNTCTCGHEFGGFEADSQFCPHCGGRRIHLDRCQSCGKAMNDSDGFCPSCGHQRTL